MRKSPYLLGAALTVVLAAGRAEAAVVYGPQSVVDVSAQAHQGPNVAGAQVGNSNGVEIYRSAGPGGSSSSSGSVAGVVGDAFIPGGAGQQVLTATAHGEASLASGTVKASVVGTGGNYFGTPGGGVDARFFDTVHFSNATAGDLALTLTWTFEGVFQSDEPGAASNGYSQLFVSGCGSCGNLRFAADGMGVGDVITATFDDENGVYAVNTYLGPHPLVGSQGHWTTDNFGVVGHLMSTTILIPTGTSDLGIGAQLYLACRASDICDFGHTGTFSFGALPNGLTWTSESGLFLSAQGLPGGGVPEPATWAMMILGFGLAGAGVRARRLQRA